MKKKPPGWLLEEVFSTKYVVGKHWRDMRSVDADAHAALAGVKLPAWSFPEEPVRMESPTDQKVCLQIVGPDQYHSSWLVDMFVGSMLVPDDDPEAGAEFYWGCRAQIGGGTGYLADSVMKGDGEGGLLVAGPWRRWWFNDFQRYATAVAKVGFRDPERFIEQWTRRQS